MADQARFDNRTLYSIFLTAFICAVAYWLWQDVTTLLRPFKGEFAQLLKNLRLVVNVLAVFIFVIIANMAFDLVGNRSWRGRIIPAGLVVGLIIWLVTQGRFFEKTIVPTVTGLWS